MKPILEINNISKKLRIYHEQKNYLSMRDSIVSLFKKSTRSKELFYALKNVSFNVNHGEAIGIVGKNGAGKSTLLKVLSKITPPTTGKIISRGRVASLLEVGTGFHQELTGRENIFLNGSILGMKKREIINKFDAIVDFSGVEMFLDTQLKHYSSGMQLRLAFSVASFLEPEILIIDEVLAVGDAEFQKKCLGKMDEVSKSGRTILFVSHNMAAVKNLCQKGIVLKKGELVAEGEINKVVNYYLENISEESEQLQFQDNNNPFGLVSQVSIEDLHNQRAKTLQIGKPWQIRVKFKLKSKVPHFILGLSIKTIDDVTIRSTWSKPNDFSAGEYEAIFYEDKIIYGQGRYKLSIDMSSRELSFYHLNDCAFIEFESYANKNHILKSGGGIILNQMEIKFQQTTHN